MENASIQRGYFKGILITLALLLIGYVLNPILGSLKFIQLSWPQNLYFVLLISAIGIAVGVISDSEQIKSLAGKGVLLPAGLCLFVIGGVSFISPVNVHSVFVQQLLTTPAMLLAIFVFWAGGFYIGQNSQHLKKKWSGILLVIGILTFSFATVVGQYDYYKLAMRIGTDRALFDAENYSGRSYRLPFAVKLLENLGADDEGVGKQQFVIRFFNTVEDYADVTLKATDSYHLKGWVIRLKAGEVLDDGSAQLIDLDLVFDRWIELKYISLGILLLGVGLKLKF